MNFEINRVYRFIIEEVCRTVEDESILTNIDSVALKELKTGWYEKLAEYTDLSNMPDMNRPISHLDFEPNYNNMMMLDNDVYMDDIRSSETVEENCDNLFMCLYVKVNKSKNKWKCQFKDGFVNIGPMDFAFSTAQGDLLFQMEEEISKLKEELSKLKKENTKLLGQVSILRANIASIEKENYNYKCQKSNSVLGNLSKLEEAKEQVKYLKTENRLIENQLKTFSKDKDTKLTLESPFVDGSFDLYPFDYERLKKIHDLYFFEFKQALNTEIVKKELNRLKKNYNIFTKFFVILCIKKELFEHFFPNLIYGYSFQDFPDSKNIFKVLKHFPIDWMQRFFLDKSLCDSLKDFINSNIENVSVVIFYTRVIEYRSYLLNFIMTIDIFTKIVKRRDFYSNFLLRTMAQNKINQFIDHSNLHFLEEEHLKVFFKEEYVPL